MLHHTMPDCLVETLDELMGQNKITEELAQAILKQFDRSIVEALENHVSAKGSMKGSMKTYKYYDNVWQFNLSSVDFKLTSPTGGGMAVSVSCDKVKVALIDEKLGQ